MSCGCEPAKLSATEKGYKARTGLATGMRAEMPNNRYIFHDVFDEHAAVSGTQRVAVILIGNSES